MAESLKTALRHYRITIFWLNTFLLIIKFPNFFHQFSDLGFDRRLFNFFYPFSYKNVLYQFSHLEFFYRVFQFVPSIVQIKVFTTVFRPKIFSLTIPIFPTNHPTKIFLADFPTQNFSTNYFKFPILWLKFFKPIFQPRNFLLVSIFFFSVIFLFKIFYTNF